MATRSKRFIAGLLTGYGTIATNVVFTMTSIPLALHYLDKEQFGLWALAAQINGYLALIDLGMSGAVSRFLADFKDDVNGGDYGSHLLTGGIVFLIQGFIIACTGFSFSWFAPTLFDIPAHLATEFRHLLLFLCAVSASSVALRSLASPLWAFQRNDIINGCASIGLFVTLGILWFGFHVGWGVMSFAYAQVPVVLGTIAVHSIVCLQNRYYPSRGHWGLPGMAVFRRMFHFGKDNLIVNLGTQLINASQIMIISRWISLDAAATFSVATKFYTMTVQLVVNPISASAPGLTELHVRGEHIRFVHRYWDLITVTLVLSTLAGSCLAVGNTPLITVWTHGKIQWSWVGDLLLGLGIVIKSFSGCFIGLFGLLKNWKPVRLIYLAEGLIFIPVAIFLAKKYGVLGVLAASLLVHLVVTTTLAFRAARHILGPWVGARKSLTAALTMICISAAFAWVGNMALLSPFIMLAATIAIALTTLATCWILIIPNKTRIEIITRVAAASQKLKKNGRPTCR